MAIDPQSDKKTPRSVSNFSRNPMISYCFPRAKFWQGWREPVSRLCKTDFGSLILIGVDHLQVSKAGSVYEKKLLRTQDVIISSSEVLSDSLRLWKCQVSRGSAAPRPLSAGAPRVADGRASARELCPLKTHPVARHTGFRRIFTNLARPRIIFSRCLHSLRLSFVVRRTFVL